MPRDAKVVADYFIRKSLDHDVHLTPMHIQKLVYLAHGWYLALVDEPLINDAVEAWEYGPVIKSLYDELKMFGADRVDKPIGRRKVNFSDNELNVLGRIYEIFSKYQAFQLSNYTHKPGSPWEQIYNPKSRNQVIPNKIISDYFKMLAQN